MIALEIYRVKIPVTSLIRLMIYLLPLMNLMVFNIIRNIGRESKGAFLALTANWLITPFPVAFFTRQISTEIYSAWINLIK